MLKQQEMYCNKVDWGYTDFHNDYQNVLLYGEPKERLTKVLIREVDTHEIPTHYAWWDNNKNEFCLIYKTKSMVDICFPYGASADKSGYICPVVVNKID